jgi:hypothetical protein
MAKGSRTSRGPFADSASLNLDSLFVASMYHASCFISFISQERMWIAFLGPRYLAKKKSCVISTSAGSIIRASICVSGIRGFISFMCLTVKPALRRAFARRMETHASTSTVLLVPMRSSKVVVAIITIRPCLFLATHRRILIKSYEIINACGTFDDPK